MTWCPIQSPCNRPDEAFRGCVPYEYEMAREQVTNADWCAFLNEVETRAPGTVERLGLWHKDMAEGVLGGIKRTTAGFMPKRDWAQKPVVYVRFEDVCRYCNWLQTKDIEKGAYDLTYMPPRRRAGAQVFIPTWDEWTKAAYYDPVTKTYWTYPTGNMLPALSAANYERGDELAVGAPYYLADVDSFAASPSPWGCLQMGGNTWEIIEDILIQKDGTRLNLYKGGSFGYTETGLSRANTDSAPYNGRCYVFGVRLARMPHGWRAKKVPQRWRLARFYARLKRWMRRVLKCVPFISGVRTAVSFCRVRTAWRRAQQVAHVFFKAGTAHGTRALIIPCDPLGVNGSRGDEAMLLATSQQILSRSAQIPIDLLVLPQVNDEKIQELHEFGFNAVKDWCVRIDVWARENLPRYQVVYILGADVVDGVYGWGTAYRLLAYFDVCSRAGLETHLLGFSWGPTPSAKMQKAFSFLPRREPLLVRDPISLSRVQKFVPRQKFELVADVAFLLQPRQTPRVATLLSWIEAEHQKGRRVVALNVHAMFNSAKAHGTIWEEAVVKALNTVQDSCGEIVYLLLPHDNRPHLSDLPILARIGSRLHAARLVEDVWHADEIKAVVGACDALIAGRMHISIAALSQAVPVLGLVYQGKFEGLWQHLGLDAQTFLPPETFVEDAPRAREQMNWFLNHLSMLRATLQNHLPHVLALARQNYNGGVPSQKEALDV